ncbi:MAG: EAL domain-containing protein [Clostridia bacterium]|nr:EAL domain-containing protein [Clostridia bacterium]
MSFKTTRQIVGIILIIILTGAILLPSAIYAEKPAKNVRVGWYESPFNSTDKNGRRSGYAYEYQLKIAAYSGWDFTYISGSWPELLQMLKDGKIDLMSDVSFTEDRANDMLFSELPMGTEEYCIFISPSNKEITAEDYSSLNGKRIGVNKGSVQVDFYNRWAEQHNVNAELVELNNTEVESIKLLSSGDLDAYITLNAYGDPETLVPICKIGSSDFYFVVNKSNPELLDEINSAMNHIQSENPYYNQRMFEKYVQRFGSNAFLTPAEKTWLTSHGLIRVGYLENYLAFCATDHDSGKVTGALKDYLEYASDCISNAHIDFETKGYATVADALEALKNGEIDCVFPTNLSTYDGEMGEILMSPAVMNTDVYAVVRQSNYSIFSNKEHITVAVTEGNSNYDSFLLDKYPNWRKVYYKDINECLRAVSDNIADCVLISNFRYNNISRMCEKYRLTTYSTGLNLDFYFAVPKGQTELYSILTKVTGLVPTSTINSALSYYISEEAKLTLGDFILKNLTYVITFVSLILILILMLLLHSLHSARKSKRLISATEIDNLTGLYNRDYFFEYANRMYREHPETPRDAIVINIEQFHSINAFNGREFGDRILCFLGNEISAIANELGGIGGRFGADRFDIYCQHTDEYTNIFNRIQTKINKLMPNISIRIRMGVMPWQKNVEPIQLFDRARTACNMARGNNNKHMIIFDDEMLEREMFEQKLLNDLGRALTNFEFEVYYQPIYDITSGTPKLVSAEALVRWQHPELGLLTPSSFIPLFERNGKVFDVDKYVWSEAARQIARWRAKYGVLFPVSLNLSRIDIFDPSLESILDDILFREGLTPGAFNLEVTETAYTENSNHLIRVVKNLRDKGFKIEMDDFGTGYSSLNMLSEMPIDALKMDREFVHNIENNQKNIQLVALILGTAKNLNIPVIAEGVETKSQLEMLQKFGCSLVQGYYFSKPINSDDFETRVLQDQAALTAKE